MTDILIATPDAKFGQPEITLGIIPGGGGTQRLAKVIGKARTMDLVLTNRWITGEEAGQWGLVSRVTKEGENVVDEAVKIGDVIAGFGAVATQAGKEAVNAGMSPAATLLSSQMLFLEPELSAHTRSTGAAPWRGTAIRETTLPLSLLHC